MEQLHSEQPGAREQLTEAYRAFQHVVDVVQPQLDEILQNDDDLFLATLESEDYDPLIFINSHLELPEGCELLAVGLMSIVIKYENSVLRFPRSTTREARDEHVSQRLATIPWGENRIDGVEELTSIDPESGTVSSRFIDGDPLDYTSLEQRQTVTTEDLRITYDAIDELHNRGFCLDNPSNFLLTSGESQPVIVIIDPIENTFSTPRTAEQDKKLLMDTLHGFLRPRRF